MRRGTVIFALMIIWIRMCGWYGAEKELRDVVWATAQLCLGCVLQLLSVKPFLRNWIGHTWTLFLEDRCLVKQKFCYLILCRMKRLHIKRKLDLCFSWRRLRLWRDIRLSTKGCVSTAAMSSVLPDDSEAWPLQTICARTSGVRKQMSLLHR